MKTALGDHPAEKCTYGETGWSNDQVNVITSIVNQTGLLMDLEGLVSPLRSVTIANLIKKTYWVFIPGRNVISHFDSWFISLVICTNPSI